MSISVPPNGKRLLVVDDDAGIRLLISTHLKKKGYDVAVAAGVQDAQRVFTERESSKTLFDAVVSDYMMPDGTGLELLEWIKQRDPSLAAIFVTAVGERDLVKKSLQTGACDFLDKPVQLPQLVASVAQAIERTARQRQLRDAESSVQEVGKLQEFMLGTNPAGLPGIMEICWHPKHAAGGDLVNVFTLGPDRLLVLAADVSGHDLTAGYISAFFQGVVRGMIDGGHPTHEVLTYFNRFLLHEWSGAQSGKAAHGDVSASIAACAFEINLAEKQLTVLNAGFPIPHFTDGASGATERCGSFASHPLGWFEDDPVTSFQHRFESGGSTYAWTDGLEDLAGSLGVSPLSLACRLLEARRQGIIPAYLKDCGDDILVVRINLNRESTTASNWVPVISDRYLGPLGTQIDALQVTWEKSLQLAVPELPEDKLFDLLLCSREAVINGIKYGCGACPTEPCTFEIAYHPAARILRVAVKDPGPGHDFNWTEHEKVAQEQMLDEHRGLILIHRMPNATQVGERGTRVTMEFHLHPAQSAWAKAA